MAITRPGDPLTGNRTIDDRMVNQLLREGHMGVRQNGPTVEHPFGQYEYIPNRLMQNDPLTTDRAGVSAIDYEQIERMRRQMMDQGQIHTGVRGMDTHTRGNRITDYEFRKELSHRLEKAHPNLLNWAMEHADTEGVDLWQVITACAVDQMLYGSSTQEPTPITDINAELKKLEEEKHGSPMAKPRSEGDQHIPF